MADVNDRDERNFKPPPKPPTKLADTMAKDGFGPTPFLRWYSPPHATGTEPVLQQLWVNDDDEARWLPVPIEHGA